MRFIHGTGNVVKTISMKKHLGIAGLLFVTIIWGSGFIATDIAIDTLTPSEFMFLRFFIAAVLMSIISYKKLKSLDKTTLMAGIFLGVTLYLAFILQTVGLKYSTPSKNAFLTSTNIVIVPFIACLFSKKRIDKFSIAGAFLAIFGIGALSINDNFTLSYGDGLTLLCAVCFAIHIYCTGIFSKKHDTITLTALQMIVAFLLSFFVLLFTEGIHIELQGSGMLSVLYSGVFCTTLAFFLQTYSQKYTTESQAAIVLSMESVFGTFFSVLIIHEKITSRIVVGCILILLAVLVSETKLCWWFPKKEISNNKVEPSFFTENKF